MTPSEHTGYCAARIPLICAVPTCPGDPATGNGWYCAVHWAECQAMLAAEAAIHTTARAAARSVRAKAAAETRRLADGSISRGGVRYTPTVAEISRGKARAAEITDRYARLRGWR
jgi:hypothetical protein